MTNYIVYIAGPMYTSGDMGENIRAALKAATELRKNGCLVFIPHLCFFWDFVMPQSRQFWIDYDLDWLSCCNAVLRLSGKSEGADLEVKRAKELGIPVYTSVKSLLKIVKGRKSVERGKTEMGISKLQKKWLAVAFDAGHEKGFRNRAIKSLVDLEKMGLIERDPTTSGNRTRWSITVKGIEEFIACVEWEAVKT
jgi:hypothetical protein